MRSVSVCFWFHSDSFVGMDRNDTQSPSNSDGLQPRSNGLHPKSDGLVQPEAAPPMPVKLSSLEGTHWCLTQGFGPG